MKRASDVTTLSVSVPLPLFKRNDAAIGQALSDATQAEIERTTAARDVQAQVRRLWSRLDSQRERVQRLQRTVMPASADNQQLAAKSRQAGQIGLLDQLLVNRQALDAERELNDALRSCTPPESNSNTRPAGRRKDLHDDGAARPMRRDARGVRLRSRAGLGARAGRMRQGRREGRARAEGDKHAEHAGEKKDEPHRRREN